MAYVYTRKLHAHTQTHIHARKHTRLSTHKHRQTDTRKRTRRRTNTHTYRRTHTHAYIHIHVNTHLFRATHTRKHTESNPHAHTKKLKRTHEHGHAHTLMKCRKKNLGKPLRSQRPTSTRAERRLIDSVHSTTELNIDPRVSSAFLAALRCTAFVKRGNGGCNGGGSRPDTCAPFFARTHRSDRLDAT